MSSFQAGGKLCVQINFTDIWSQHQGRVWYFKTTKNLQHWLQMWFILLHLSLASNVHVKSIWTHSGGEGTGAGVWGNLQTDYSKNVNNGKGGVKKSPGICYLIYKQCRQFFWIFDTPLPHVDSFLVPSVSNFDQFLTPSNWWRCLCLEF